MKIKTIFLFSLFSAGAGIVLFAYLNKWIIIDYPTITGTAQHMIPAFRSQKKKIDLVYWRAPEWRTETTDLIWTDNPTTNLIYLADTWLSLADEEKIIDRKVSLQTAIINPLQKNAYVSFDRSPFNTQQTIMQKWMLIEGLLKSIARSDIEVKTVNFLENHQPLIDLHLDFTNAWPIEGFMQS